MGWEVQSYHCGADRDANRLRASIAWRDRRGNQSGRAEVGLSKALVRELGWTEETRFTIMHGTDEHAGLTVVKPVDKERGYVLQLHRGAAKIAFQLPKVNAATRRAEPIGISIDGSTLILIRPDWAAPERLQQNTDRSLDAVVRLVDVRCDPPVEKRPKKKATIPAPSPEEIQDAEDRAEALRMIGLGDTNEKIADWLGWPAEKVEALRQKRAA